MTLSLDTRARSLSRASLHPDALGAMATRALLVELDTWPKPGLVSHVDRGAHRDMDASMMRASAEVLSPFFVQLAAAGQRGAAMRELRDIGLSAESAMMRATGGINTHRGAIFGLGLLCAAAGAVSTAAGAVSTAAAAVSTAASVAPGALGREVRERWGDAIVLGAKSAAGASGHRPGADVRRRHGCGGAPAEAAAGFPTVYGAGLPALARGRVLAASDEEAARVHACFALIASMGDTNLVHRGGIDGLRFAQAAAASFLRAGGVGRCGWRTEAEAIHRTFTARRLSPGGSADLLAMTLFVEAVEGPRRSPLVPIGTRARAPG